MAKRPGRERRQDVVRDSEGRIAASEYRREDERSPAAWNRLRDIATEISLDNRLVSQLGRLFYNRQLSPIQFEVGCRWADYLADYDRIKLGRNRTPAPPSFEAHSPSEPSALLSDKDASFLERFGKAHTALLTGGMLVEGATNRLCRGESCGAMFNEAIRGLDLLAEHWGLTNVRKSRR